MKSMNKVIVSGHLGQNPEKNGAVKFSVAVNDTYSDEEGKHERVNWIAIVCFGKVGENAQQYLKKGAHVLVEGSLRQNIWEPEPGKKQSRLEVIASNVIFLDKRPAAEQTSLPSEAPAPAEPKKAKK